MQQQIRGVSIPQGFSNAPQLLVQLMQYYAAVQTM